MKHRYGKSKTNKQRLHREEKQKKAAERLAKYNKMSTQEKIAWLDSKLGDGVGAVKQRERLAKQLGT